MDLLVELGAVLFLIPALGFLFVVHLLDNISHEVALEVGSINAHELALTGKVGLVATLLHLALPGDKVILPRRVNKRNTGQVKHYGIVTAEYIALAIGCHHSNANGGPYRVGGWEHGHGIGGLSLQT